MVKFHQQTTEIQPFKVEYFSTKTLKFQHNDVNIYDVSKDFGIFFGMQNRLLISYLCAKFYCDMTIITGDKCIFHVWFLYFSTNRQMFQHNDVIIYDVIANIYSVSAFSVRFCPLLPLCRVLLLWTYKQVNKAGGGVESTPPQWYTRLSEPSRNRVNLGFGPMIIKVSICLTFT